MGRVAAKDGRLALERLRKLCLALPEAHEKEAWGDPTFRVKDKIFAMHKVGDGRQSLWCKADPYERDALVEAEPEAFYASAGHDVSDRPIPTHRALWDDLRRQLV
jgi:hypothetical protein